MATKQKQKINKTALIPKVGSIGRILLIDFLPEINEYKEALGKKTRLFTVAELSSFEEKYKEGMTWEEIEMELCSHGIEMTKSAFRKHIHDKLLPESGKRAEGTARMTRQTKEGKTLAVFPKDMISQINFNRFFLKCADRTFLENPLKTLLAQPRVSYFGAIESCLGGGVYGGLLGALDDEVFHGWENATEAIEKALASRQEDKKEIIDKIEHLCNKVEEIRSEIDELVSLLERKKISIPEFLSLEEE